MEWETVIGLEVHAQLNTKAKLFSGSATTYGAAPNTQACAVDLGLPGVLPVLNKEAVNLAIKFGLAVGADIQEKSAFDRKNYFYPDLPKGYQISQFFFPILRGGSIDIELEEGQSKTINITRAHLEEDAGKSVHDQFVKNTGIDLNRAGVPLLEIVSEPDMRSSAEAVAYLKALHALVKYIDICNGNMQEGSFRCDANVSVRPKGQKEFGTRAEIKNVNSFKFVEKAIEYEVARQIALIESGGTVVQETRLFDAQKGDTRSMRAKEEANDYRYFHDPDLPPLKVDIAMINTIKDNMPELPAAKLTRFMQEYELTDYEGKILTASKAMAEFYEQAVAATDKKYKLTANWIIGELSAALNKEAMEIEDAPLTAKQLGALMHRIEDNTVSNKLAKTVFEEMWATGKEPDQIIDEKGLRQVTDTAAIEKIIDQVFADNPNQLEQYRAGKDKLFGFFVGQVMKASQGKANPDQVNELLKKKL